MEFPSEIELTQRELCTRFNVEFMPPERGTTLGFAVTSRDKKPVYGIRHLPHMNTNGWYVWCGDKTDDSSFFQALHPIHLVERCPTALRFLALPPGYGFITDGDYIDVWYDKRFLVR